MMEENQNSCEKCGKKFNINEFVIDGINFCPDHRRDWVVDRRHYDENANENDI